VIGVLAGIASAAEHSFLRTVSTGYLIGYMLVLGSPGLHGLADAGHLTGGTGG